MGFAEGRRNPSVHISI